MTSNTKTKPYICPDHPKAIVLHSWDEDYFCYGDNVGKPFTHSHRYECAECGRELAATLEKSSNTKGEDK